MTNSGDVKIPGWFVKVASLFMAVMIVWCSFVTHWIYQVPQNSIDIDAVKARFELHELSYNAHLSDSTIHHGGMRTIEVSYNEIIRRLDKLEKKVEQGFANPH